MASTRPSFPDIADLVRRIEKLEQRLNTLTEDRLNKKIARHELTNEVNEALDRLRNIEALLMDGLSIKRVSETVNHSRVSPEVEEKREGDWLMTCPQAAEFLFAENMPKTRQRVIRRFKSGKFLGRQEGEGPKATYFIRHSSATRYRDEDC